MEERFFMTKGKLLRDVYHLSDFYFGDSSGRYDIPQIKKVNFLPERLIDFSQALTAKDFGAGVHFYIDDAKFECIWRAPQRYLPILKKFSCVFSPDFSLYLDMPLAMKIWNVYRSRLLGQIMQRAGITVIPTISWAGKETYSFCFSGIQSGSVVSISSVGTMNTAKSTEVFLQGCRKMCLKIKPEAILIYGKIPDFDFGKIKIFHYNYSRFDWKKNKKVVY